MKTKALLKQMIIKKAMKNNAMYILQELDTFSL